MRRAGWLAMEFWHYVDAAGEEHGPCATMEMGRLLSLGVIDDGTLVRKDGGPMRFQPLSKVRALREATGASGIEVEPNPVQDSTETLSNEWYYFDDGGCERGPLDTAQLRALIDQGFVCGPRLVRNGLNGPTRDISLWPELSMDLSDIPAIKPDMQPALADAADEEWDWEAEAAEWVYRDDDGEIQGPFGTQDMVAWLELGHLEPSRLVNVAGGDLDDFRPISEWAELQPRAPQADDAEGPAAAAVGTGEGATGIPSEEEPLAPLASRVGEAANKAEGQPDAAVALVASQVVASSMAAAEADEEERWCYVDDHGTEQGPFTTSKLCGWVRRRLLSGDRLCHPAGGTEQRPMRLWPQLAVAVEEAAAAVAAAGAAQAVAADLSADTAAAPEAVADVTPAVDASSALEENALWEYRDDCGKAQGPFTARKLLSWLKAGHLKPRRAARPVSPPAVAAAAEGTAEVVAESFKPLAQWAWFAAALAAGALPAAPPVAPQLGGTDGAAVETPLWLYLDVASHEQGPYTATQLQHWWSHGYLPASTRVRHLYEPRTSYRVLTQVPQLGCFAPPTPMPPSSAGGEPSAGSSMLGNDACSSSGHVGSSCDSQAPPSGAEVHSILAQLHRDGDGAAGGSTPRSDVAIGAAASLAPTAITRFTEYRVTGGFSAVDGRFNALAGDAYWDSKGIPRHRDERQMGHYFDFATWQEERNMQKAKQSHGKRRRA